MSFLFYIYVFMSMKEGSGGERINKDTFHGKYILYDALSNRHFWERQESAGGRGRWNIKSIKWLPFSVLVSTPVGNAT